MLHSRILSKYYAPLAFSRTLSVLRSCPSRRRHFSTTTTALDPTKTVVSTIAVYHEHGNVLDVLNQTNEILKAPQDLEGTELIIKFLAAPINPADFNMIEGVYSIRPRLPAIGGNEGVAEVVAVGPDVKNMAVGDWVIPALPGFGTWRTYAVCEEEDLSSMVNDIPAEYAASLAVNPCTAFRILRDFHKLKPGDVIVQNGANSMVGQAVIQLAREINVKTINVIRNRQNPEENKELIERLMKLGADHVFTDDGIPTETTSLQLPKPILALNAVGGRSSMAIARLLADGGSMITYGGMSRKPVQVGTGNLIFNDISARGFWLSRWTQQHTEEERMSMIRELADMVRENKLEYAMGLCNFETEFGAAVRTARSGFRTKKTVFKFE